MPNTVEKVPNQLPQEITSLNYMFNNATSFNQDVSKWNVSNVTNMSIMFFNATSFNQDISKWNVSNVTIHDNFSTDSGISDNKKLPKFKPVYR